MTTDTALLQQALDALETTIEAANSRLYGDNEQSKAISAIKARLAQPEQEPVAWMDGKKIYFEDTLKALGIQFKESKWTPLYTSPSPAYRLYDELPKSSKFNAFIRAFWRRINAHKNDFDKELPEEMPVQFRASMETALLVFDKEPAAYTHTQPERKPLSKSVIKRLWHQADKEPENFARAIEKVHGITE
jgi:hypothetical protein